MNNVYFQIQNERYKKFCTQIENLGIPIGECENNKYEELVSILAEKSSITICNNKRSFRYGYISDACHYCHKGDKSHTFITSLECNNDCYYCANENQILKDNAPLIQQYDNYPKKDELKSIGITGGEPFLFKDEVINFIRYVKLDHPECYIRVYTCGNLIDDKLIKELKDSGLDEIRVSIKPESMQDSDYNVYEVLTKCIDNISNVLVEMPVFPDKEEYMQDLLIKLNNLGVTGINLLEFLYPFHNKDEYISRDYKIKNEPLRILYDYEYPGGLPIAGSELLALKLINFANDEKLNLGVHYCSLENKYTSQIYNQNKSIKLEKWEMIDPEDFFIKSILVMFNNSTECNTIIDTLNLQNDEYSLKEGCLIINPIHLHKLKDWPHEAMISYSIAEKNSYGTVIKEIHYEELNTRIL